MTTATTPPTSVFLEHRESGVLAQTAYARFAEVVEGLGDADWVLPTDCTAWTVRDLVGHMVGAMRSAASVREMGSQLREIRARVKRDGGNQTDVMTQVQVERTAGLSTADLARECRALVGPAAAGRRRAPRLLRSLVRFPVEVAGVTETWTLGYLNDVILTRDAWMHRVDLCRAVGADLELTADHDGRIVADVVSEWARRHRAAFRLALSGPAGGTFAQGREGQQLELDAVEFCRVVSGRRPGSGLLATEVPF